MREEFKRLGLKVCEEYGGNPDDVAWHTPQGIASIIEDVGGTARAAAARMAAAETELKWLHEERTKLLRVLVAECPGFPGIPNTCDAETCDCFAAHDLATTARQALTAARRAGAEEMRERCAKAAQEAPDTWTSLSDLRWQQSIAYKCASAIRALHSDAKGGDT